MQQVMCSCRQMLKKDDDKKKAEQPKDDVSEQRTLEELSSIATPSGSDSVHLASIVTRHALPRRSVTRSIIEENEKLSAERRRSREFSFLIAGLHQTPIVAVMMKERRLTLPLNVSADGSLCASSSDEEDNNCGVPPAGLSAKLFAPMLSMRPYSRCYYIGACTCQNSHQQAQR